MNNAEPKQRCDDCNKNEYPVYQVNYTHPDISIRNVVTNKTQSVPGRQIAKMVCAACVCLYQKVTIEKEGVFNAKV